MVHARHPANYWKPNRHAPYYTRQIILAKLHAENYARSNGTGAKLLAETYAKKAAELENALIERYRFDCKFYYSEQDEVIEDRISSYINYTEEFMRVHNAKRAFTFQ